MGFREHLNEKASFFDADYIIREVKPGTNEYEVSKWLKGKNPDDVYRCFHNKANNKWSCSCPTKVKPCKHIALVKEWLAKGKKQFIDDTEAIKWAKEVFKEER